MLSSHWAKQPVPGHLGVGWGQQEESRVVLMELIVSEEIVHQRFHSWVTLLSVRNIISSSGSFSSVSKQQEFRTEGVVQTREVKMWG